MNWRRLLRVTHRDLGFLCVGLTLLYAISGVAVNHIDQWNPNYEIEVMQLALGPLPQLPLTGVADVANVAAHALGAIGDTSPLKSTYRRDPITLDIFSEKSTISLNLQTGTAKVETARERNFIFPLNYLHLNHPKKAWSWVADLYAVALIVLTLTGIFLVKGGRGLLGRGGVLVMAGFLVPVFFFVLYH